MSLNPPHCLSYILNSGGFGHLWIWRLCVIYHLLFIIDYLSFIIHLLSVNPPRDILSCGSFGHLWIRRLLIIHNLLLIIYHLLLIIYYLLLILTPRTRLSCSCSCCCVTEKSPANTLSNG